MWYSMSIFSFMEHTLSELFWKTVKWWKIYQQRRSIFYPSNDVCLQYYLLRRKKYISCVVAMRARFTTWVLQHQHLRQVKMYFYLLSFHLSLYWNMYLRVVLLWCFKEIIIFLDAVRNKFQTKYLLELFKRQKLITWAWFEFWPMKKIFQKP